MPPNLFNPPSNRCLPPPQLLEGNFALFCTYTLGFRNEFQNILLAIMVRMALWWSPLGLGLRWAEGREAVGLRWSAVGTVTEGLLGGGEGEGAAKRPAKGVWVGRNSEAFVPT